jgi:PAS domain S-box-containing protein
MVGLHMQKSRVELVRASKLDGLALRRDPQRLATLEKLRAVQYEASQYAQATLERMALVVNTSNLFVALVFEQHCEILASKNLDLKHQLPFVASLEVILASRLQQISHAQEVAEVCQALHLNQRFAALLVVPLRHPNGALLGCIGALNPLPLQLQASQHNLLEYIASDLLEKIELRLIGLAKPQSTPMLDTDLWALLSSTSEAIVAQDLQGRICFWNRAAEQLYGYTAQQIIGRELGFLFSQNSLELMRPMLEQVLMGQTVAPCLVEHRHSSGFRVNVRMALSSLQDKSGNACGAVMVCGVPDNPQQSMQHLMLERLTQHIPMFAIQLDQYGVVVAAQGKLLKPSLVVGQAIWQVFADTPELIVAAKKALNATSLHARLKWQERHLECWFVPWQQGVSLLALDVSQQVQTQLALEASESQMREILHALPMYFWRCDPFGTITMFDSATSQTPNPRIGQNAFDVFATSSSLVHGLRNILMGETLHISVQWQKRNFEVWGSPFFIEDRIAGATGVAIDVTEETEQRAMLAQTQAKLRQEQERTHIIANSISQGLSIVDNNGFFVYVNPARAEMQGYLPEEMLGQPVKAFLEPSEHARFEQMTEWARSGEPLQTTRRMRHRDGTWFEVQLLARAWYQDGKVAGVVSVLNDITVQKALERQLSAQNNTVPTVALHQDSQGFAPRDSQGLAPRDSQGLAPREQISSSHMVVLPNVAAANAFMEGVGGAAHFQASFEPSPPEPSQPRLVLRGRSLTLVVLEGRLEEQ